MDNPQQAFIPGPGAYKQQTIVESLNKKPWGKQGVFGSTEKRFVQPHALVTPGPGLYKPERSITILAKKNETNIKRSSSMFISQVKRQPHVLPKHI
jgi:Sperm-tail PG-rich repeat